MDDIVIYSRKEKYLGTPRGKVAPQVNRISLSTSIVHSTTDRTEPIKNTVSRLLSRTVDLVTEQRHITQANNKPATQPFFPLESGPDHAPY
jgi:hypothetical protein